MLLICTPAWAKKNLRLVNHVTAFSITTTLFRGGAANKAVFSPHMRAFYAGELSGAMGKVSTRGSKSFKGKARGNSQRSSLFFSSTKERRGDAFHCYYCCSYQLHRGRPGIETASHIRRALLHTRRNSEFSARELELLQCYNNDCNIAT